MPSKLDDNIRNGVHGHLEPGEEVLATLVVSVRGHQQAMVGGVAGMVGAGRKAKARKAADAAGIRLASPMALVLTTRRLLTVKTGGRGKVQELLDDYPHAEVGAMEVKRFGLGAAVTLVLRNVPVKLESRVGASREFAGDLERVLAA